MRYPVLDGFRGFFLVFMAVHHLNAELRTVLGSLNHHRVGWVEDAQGFVFISGFVVGLVYGGKYLRRSFADMQGAVWRRIGTIYTWQVGLIVAGASAALILALVDATPRMLAAYSEAPVLMTVASMLLVSGTPHLGILPMYIWFMAVTPFVLWAFRNGHAPAVLVISAAAWLLAQTGLGDGVVASLEIAFEARGHPVPLGIYFDVFGWQAIYFAGLYLGFLQAEERLDLSFLRAPQLRSAVALGVVVWLVLALYDRAVFDAWFGAATSASLLAPIDRGALSGIYVLAFFLDLFLVAWLFVAGPQSGIRPVERLAALGWRLFTWPPLVRLGRHSLAVYSYHVVLVYVVSACLDGRNLAEGPATVLLLTGVLSLYLAVWLDGADRRRLATRPATIPVGTGRS